MVGSARPDVGVPLAEIPMEQKVITTLQDTLSTIWAYVPSLIGALAVLVIGWIVAGLLARGVRIGVEKTGLVSRVSKLVTDIDAEDEKTFEEWIGKSVFIIVMLFSDTG